MGKNGRKTSELISKILNILATITTSALTIGLSLVYGEKADVFFRNPIISVAMFIIFGIIQICSHFLTWIPYENRSKRREEHNSPVSEQRLPTSKKIMRLLYTFEIISFIIIIISFALFSRKALFALYTTNFYLSIGFLILLGIYLGLLLFPISVIFQKMYSRVFHKQSKKKSQVPIEKRVLVLISIFALILNIGAIAYTNSDRLFTQQYSRLNSFNDSFNDEISGTDPSHWMENTELRRDSWKLNSNCGENKFYLHNTTNTDGDYTLLHVFSRETLIEGDIILDPTTLTNGEFWLLTRWNDAGSWVRAGIKFDERAQGKWMIQEKTMRDGPITTLAETTANIELSTEPFPPQDSSMWMNLKLIADGPSVGFYLNNISILKAFCVKASYGRVGFQAEGIVVAVDNVKYSGDGRVQDGVYENTIRPGHTMDLEVMDNGTIIQLQEGWIAYSHDNGETWMDRHQPLPGLKPLSILRTQNGSFIMTAREEGTTPETFRDFCTISSDNTMTWNGKYYIQPNWQNRITMNNKLMQTSTGRIFFTSGESGDGKEEMGGIWNFYSDDGGKSWIAAETKLDWTTFGQNLQEGKVMESSDGLLRTIIRSDEGTLKESLSTDQGNTWSTPVAIPELLGPLCAFNVEKDPETGNHWMFWCYDDIDKAPRAQRPRVRISLAMSNNGGENWSYVCDVDDYEIKGIDTGRFMNLGIKVIGDSIFCTNGRKVGEWEMRQCRFNKTLLIPQATFPPIHYPNPECEYLNFM